MPLYLRESEGRNDTDDRTNFFFFFFIVHLIILSSQLKKLLHAAHSTLPNAFNPTIIFLISKFTNALEFNSKTPRLIPTRATTSFEIPHRRLNPSNQRDYSSLDPSTSAQTTKTPSRIEQSFSLFPFSFFFSFFPADRSFTKDWHRVVPRIFTLRSEDAKSSRQSTLAMRRHGSPFWHGGAATVPPPPRRPLAVPRRGTTTSRGTEAVRGTRSIIQRRVRAH